MTRIDLGRFLPALPAAERTGLAQRVPAGAAAIETDALVQLATTEDLPHLCAALRLIGLLPSATASATSSDVAPAPESRTPLAPVVAKHWRGEQQGVAHLPEAAGHLLARVTTWRSTSAQTTAEHLRAIFRTAEQVAQAQGTSALISAMGPLVDALDALVQQAPHFGSAAQFDRLSAQEQLWAIEARFVLGEAIQQAFSVLDDRVNLIQHDELAFSSFDTALHLHDGKTRTLQVQLRADEALVIPFELLTHERLDVRVEGGDVALVARPDSIDTTPMHHTDATWHCPCDDLRYAIVRGYGTATIHMTVQPATLAP